MARSYLLSGPAGTWKSSFGIVDATPEDPVDYHEWEPGGFKRAAQRLNLHPDAVTVHKYRIPFQELEQLGEAKVILTGSGSPMPQLRYELKGWTEEAARFAHEYMDGIKAKRRPIVDTATRLWLALRQSFEQEVQDATNGGDARKLDRLKYTTPNAQMVGVLEWPNDEMDSIFISHEKQVWDSNPPIYVPDTMAEVETTVDVHLRFRLVAGKAVATIKKGAEVGALVGLEIEQPTLRKVNLLLDVAAAISANESEMPDTAEGIFRLGRMLKFEGVEQYL